jgi:hypothetical protein
VLLHDNAHLHTAACTLAVFEVFQLGVVWPSSLQPWSCSKWLPPVYLHEELFGITALQQ